MSVFQYMVGNTDWSMVRFHNVEVSRTPRGVYVPVPYDFDWTGLVSTRYARPNEGLGIRSVRQRFTGVSAVRISISRRSTPSS